MKARNFASLNHTTRKRAFTLIELLVVIAIIAILAAILFPVFATVREQARQGNAMSSMHSVYLGARTFYEDEGRYPTVLFGYAESPNNSLNPPFQPYLNGMPGTMRVMDMTKLVPMSQSHNFFITFGDDPARASINRGYLYREQIKDYITFLNPDNPVKQQDEITTAYYPSTPSVPAALRGQLVTWQDTPNPDPFDANGCRPIGDRDLPSSAYKGMPKWFYVQDSMDIGPRLNADGTWATDAMGNHQYELHYAPDWTHQLCKNGQDAYIDYKGNASVAVQQLKYRNPPTDRTVVTYITQHAATAGSPNILVLLDDGTVKKMNINQMNVLPLDYGK